jgi:catechol-2,3-dioxygenase
MSANPANPMAYELAHLVINVGNLDASVDFYCKVLGLKVRRRGDVNGRNMAFLHFDRQDHDIGMVEVGHAAPTGAGRGPGLRHIAFRVGSHMDDLRAFRHHLEGLGIAPARTARHRTSLSIYLQDPDGIELEGFIDSDTPIWHADAPIEVRNPDLQL